MSLYYLKNADGTVCQGRYMNWARIWTHLGLLCVALVVVGLAGCPQYNVWQQGLVGKAELKRAEQNRQVAVLEAQAKLDAAELLNQAEVARAQGLAEATALVVDSFGGPDAYLRYLWIQGIEDGAKPSVIYVPTEAGLPLLEAGKRQ